MYIVDEFNIHRIQCKVTSDCNSTLICRDSKCVDPCDDDYDYPICGSNTVCGVEHNANANEEYDYKEGDPDSTDYTPLCSCMPGYTWEGDGDFFDDCGKYNSLIETSDSGGFRERNRLAPLYIIATHSP